MMDKLREARARAEEAVSDHVTIWLPTFEITIILRMKYEGKINADVNYMLFLSQDF